MKVLVLLWVIAALAVASAAVCTPSDTDIYVHRGHEFAATFRTYGGYWVTNAQFRDAVVAGFGLSESCASCYATAFRCGYDKCFYSCLSAGATCDKCLASQGCTAQCNECTGFISSTRASTPRAGTGARP